MGIRGTTKAILLAPGFAPELDPSENFLPAELEVRNGRTTLPGNWERRPGLARQWQVEEAEPIVAVIPDGFGYVISRSGRIHRIDRTRLGLTAADQVAVQRLVDAALSNPDGPELNRIRGVLLQQRTRLETLAGLLTENLLAGDSPFPNELTLAVLVAGTLGQVVIDLLLLGSALPVPDLTEALAATTAQVAALAVQARVQELITTAQPPAVDAIQAVALVAVLVSGLIDQLGHTLGSDAVTIAQFIAQHRQPLLEDLGGRRLNGLRRPTWDNFNGTILVCDGGAPVAIAPSGVAAPIAGGPPAARFVAVVNSVVVMAGFNDVGFRWAQVNTFDRWPIENFDEVQRRGDPLRCMLALRSELLFFLGKTIEVWVNIGGERVFARRTTIERGTAADYSPVKANDTVYWLGNDRNFYVLEGSTARPISPVLRRLMKSLQHPELVYGLHFEREQQIRWFAPADGLAFTFDYVHGGWSIDCRWQADEPALWPVNSYGELGGQGYAGDTDPTGRVFHLGPEHADDNGEVIRMSRRFQVAPSPSGLQVRVNQLRLRLKRGTAATNAQALLMIRWRFDQDVWGPYEHLDLGPVGDRDPFIDIGPMGAGADLEVEIVETDSAPEMLVTDGFLTFEELTR